MRIPSTFVFTHDSIGVGEDGPTHQPIEQLAALRATPNINVVRPAGFNETALAWRFALERDRDADRAGALAPGRAGVGPGGRAARRDRARRLRPARTADGEPDADPDGHRHRGPHRPRRGSSSSRRRACKVRLVSHAVPGPLRGAGPGLPRLACCRPRVRARVAVEAAGPLGWHRWVGDAGEVVAMTGFGASAPAKALYKHFGFTGENVADAAPAALDRGVDRELHHQAAQRLGGRVQALRAADVADPPSRGLLGRGGDLLGGRRGGLGQRRRARSCARGESSAWPAASREASVIASTREATARARGGDALELAAREATVRTEVSVREAPSPASDGDALGHAGDVVDDLVGRARRPRRTARRACAPRRRRRRSPGRSRRRGRPRSRR